MFSTLQRKSALIIMGVLAYFLVLVPLFLSIEDVLTVHIATSVSHHVSLLEFFREGLCRGKCLSIFSSVSLLSTMLFIALVSLIGGVFLSSKGHGWYVVAKR